MKWLKPTGPTQTSADGKYIVMHATSHWWVAYFQPAPHEWERIGERDSDEKAKDACDDHARLQTHPAQAAPQS